LVRYSSAQDTLGGHNHKPLVDTESLQAAIKSENLLARAKDLYKIAELGEPEYNHPTRVIGSAGQFSLYLAGVFLSGPYWI
jgi:aminopeptidase Y